MTGERQQLDCLVREHLPDALRFATRLTGSLNEAEDVIQDAMVNAVRGWAGFRRDASFRTWLYRIVINAFHDRAARPDRIGIELNETADHRGQPPDARSEFQEMRESVARHVSRLPPQQRAVLIMASYEQMTAAQIAETLQITTANVHATLHAARSRLRRQLRSLLTEKPQ